MAATAAAEVEAADEAVAVGTGLMRSSSLSETVLWSCSSLDEGSLAEGLEAKPGAFSEAAPPQATWQSWCVIGRRFGVSEEGKVTKEGRNQTMNEARVASASNDQSSLFLFFHCEKANSHTRNDSLV